MSVSYAGMEQLPAWLVRGRWLKLLRVSIGLLVNGVALRTIGAQILGPFLPTKIWSLLLRLHGRNESIAFHSAVNLNALDTLNSRPDFAHDFSWRPSSQSTELRHFVLTRGDGGNFYKGILAEFGISVRDPTADKRVMEYCLAAPVSEYLRGGIARSLGRRAFGTRIAPEALNERRKGIQSADWYESFGHSADKLKREVDAIGRCADAAAALEPGWLDATVANLPSDDWASESVVMRYRYGLLRGIAAGHFMRKVKGTN